MRLIDADEVLARIENPYQKAEIARWLRDAPTIERKTGTPCDLCRHNPPSSGDGKPCSYCPAEQI